MGGSAQQPEVLSDWIARLEKQNRVLKRAGIVLFALCFLTSALMGWQLKKISRATGLQGQNKIISANQFNLIDENGKIQGFLSASSGGAFLSLTGAEGKAGLFFHPSPGGSTLSLDSPDGARVIDMDVSDDFSFLTIGTRKDGADKILMKAGGGVQNVELLDSAGYRAVLGSAALVEPETGETRNTSAAALTLFGKDGHVLWKTPRP